MTILSGSLAREYNRLTPIIFSCLPKLRNKLLKVDIDFKEKDSILKVTEKLLSSHIFTPIVKSSWEEKLEKALETVVDDLISIVEDFEREEMGCVRMLLEFLMESSLYAETVREIGRKIKIPEIGSILELNSGTGRSSLELAKISKRKVIGIEADEKCIKIARDYLKTEKVNNVVFIHGDPLRAGRYISEPIFAIVFISPVTWLYDIETLISKAYTLLEFGGVIYGSYPLRERPDSPNIIEPFLKLFGGVTPPDKNRLKWLFDREGYHKPSIQKAGPLYFFKASKV